MADGQSRIDGYLLGEDTLSTLSVLEALGVGITRQGDTVIVAGVGLRGAKPANQVLDVGNSGTLLRLVAGWLSGQSGHEWVLDGDDSIRSRPMARIADPLAAFGGDISLTDGRAPMTVRGAHLRGGEWRSPVASAQVKSAVLLAGLNSDEGAALVEPLASRDHTERMLAEQGARVTVTGESGGHRVEIEPCDQLQPVDRVIPGDPSSAAFLALAATLVPDSDVVIEGVNLNPSRIGFFRILERMGAKIEGLPDAASELDPTGPEPVGDVRVRHSELRGTEVGAADIPGAVDEITLVGLAACFAIGETVVSGAEELRVKETDRIARVTEILRALGAEVDAADDGFAVNGTGGLRGGGIDSFGDHRLAMLGAVAGLASEQGVEVSNFEAAEVSYPGFEADIQSLA
jgi:3-phosphoshikimate 1-carboxyvinyltransferase